MRFFTSLFLTALISGTSTLVMAQQPGAGQMLQMTIFATELNAKCEALTLEGRLYARQLHSSIFSHASQQGGGEALSHMTKKWQTEAQARIAKPCSEIVKDAQLMQVMTSFNDEGAVQSAAWTEVPEGSCSPTATVLEKSKAARAYLNNKVTPDQVTTAITPRVTEFMAHCNRDLSGGPICTPGGMLYDPDDCVRAKTKAMFESLPAGNIMKSLAFTYGKLESFDPAATDFQYFGSGLDGVRGKGVLFPVQYKSLHIMEPGSTHRYNLKLLVTSSKKLKVIPSADMARELPIQAVYISPHRDGSDATPLTLASGGDKDNTRTYVLPAQAETEWLSQSGEDAYRYLLFDMTHLGKNITRRASLNGDNMGMPISGETLNEAYKWATAPALK